MFYCTIFLEVFFWVIKMKFQVKDIIEITGGELLLSTNMAGLFSISTDSRTISPEEIFLPLTGENFDGHNFIETAIEKGARGFFIDKKHKKEFNSLRNGVKFIISVENTLEAYLKLANFYRKKVNPIVIGITGSSGKTTTKEMMFSVLSQQYKTHKSKLNHNNEIGLCQTLLNMPADAEFLVIEMGMRGLGEIELLSKYAEPDIAIITNIGTSHIGRLGSIENIVKAKCEITKALNKEGMLIALDQNLTRQINDWKGKLIFYNLNDVKLNKINNKGSNFTYKGTQYQLNVPGEYNIMNALAAIEAAKAAGLTSDQIKAGLMSYQSLDNRGEIFELDNNIKIVNDSYNANPDSMIASITATISSYKKSKIVLVLGDMAELGDQETELHKSVGDFLSDKDIYELITVGEKAKYISSSLKNDKIKIKSFTQNVEAIEYLQKHLEPDSIVLLKASRCMSFEKIAEKLKG